MHHFLSPFVIDKGRIKVIHRFCDIASSRQTPCCCVLIDLVFFFHSYNHCLRKGDFWQASVEQRSLQKDATVISVVFQQDWILQCRRYLFNFQTNHLRNKEGWTKAHCDQFLKWSRGKFTWQRLNLCS